MFGGEIIMQKRKVSVGIIGCGRMGSAHAYNVTQIPETELTAVCDVDIDRAKKTGDDYGVEFYQNEEAILNNPHIDFVFVATPTPYHVHTVIKAAQRGKHIFCEKPLTLNLEEAKAIKEAVTTNGVHFGMNFMRRQSWLEKRIRELLPTLGEPKMCQAVNINAGYCRQKGDWFADMNICGGYTIDTMIHLLDIMRWWFGEAISVCGNGLLLSPGLPEPMDYTVANITFRSNFVATVSGGWIRRGLSIDEAYYLIGTEGTICYDSLSKTLRVFSKDGSFEETGENTESPHLRLLREFALSIIEDREFAPSLNDGIESLKTALAIVDSIKGGGGLQII